MEIICHNKTVFVKRENTLFCCGNNCEGQLGLGDKKNRNIFEKINYDFGKIKNIAISGYSTYVLNHNDEIFVCGDNSSGELGLCDTKTRTLFTKINFDFGKIKIFVVNCDSIFIVNTNNNIYCCGQNYIGGKYTKKICGQLGFNEKTHIAKFMQIDNIFGNITDIIMESFSTFIINDNSEVFCCGHNNKGKLGLGCETEYITKFTKINFDFGKIKKLITNYNATYIFNDKYEVFSVGDNNYGQLGLKNYDDKNIFTKINFNFGEIDDIYSYCSSVLVKNKNNELFISGHESYNLTPENKSHTFKKINFDFGQIKKINFDYSFVVLNYDGDVYCCGSNYYNELDVSDEIIENNITNIEKFTKLEKNGFEDNSYIGNIINFTTEEHNLYIINDKYIIYSFGSNSHGQAGSEGEKETNVIFNKIDFDFKKYIDIYNNDYYNLKFNEIIL
jgi:alpha-tubulin suppressor-like RCC1 family protein